MINAQFSTLNFQGLEETECEFQYSEDICLAELQSIIEKDEASVSDDWKTMPPAREPERRGRNSGCLPQTAAREKALDFRP